MSNADEQLSMAELLAELRRAASRPPAWEPPPGVADEALLWLALVPQVTAAIAAEARFPGDLDTLDDLVELGLLERQEPADEAPFPDDPAEAAGDEPPERQGLEGKRAPFYVMAESMRFETLRAYRGDDPGQLAARNEAIRVVLASAGAGLAGSPTCGRELPALARWGQLAQHATRPNEVASALSRAVDAAFDQGDSADLLAWIESARPLATLLRSMGDVDLADALERAGRRLDLLYRRVDDERRLRSFVPRPEQIAAVSAFLRGSEAEPTWAIHLIGHGGVGKTMLIRYIVTTMAREQNFAVARVDFDYLNPDYPNLNPGLLLSSFSAELAAQAPPVESVRIGKAFADAEHSFDQARRSLERAGLAQRHLERPWAEQSFVRGVEHYCEALRLFGRPVILVLDTCEELAKVRPDGSLVNVEATFAILRALHEGAHTLSEDPATSPTPGLPRLRVIFSGRRLIASAGAGWHQERSGPPGEQPAAQLPPRPFLKVAQLRGFSYAEARSYLARVARGPDGLRYHAHGVPDDPSLVRVPEELIEPIVERSTPDIGPTRELRIEGGAAADDQAARCNPFLVAFYAGWATQPSPPSPAEIRTTSVSHYIKQRIVDRLGSRQLADLLPLATVLGFVNQPLIAAVVNEHGEDAQTAFRRLADQEWMLRQSGRSEVIGVQPEMRGWLDEYYATPGAYGPRFKTLLGRAISYLRAQTGEELDPAKLDWPVVHAAMRALEQLDPQDAARWWEGLMARLRQQRDAAWLIALLGPLQAEDGAAGQSEARGRPTSQLRAAVRAAYASALLHDGRLSELGPVWADVEALAPRAPLGADWLLVRAVAGQLTAAWTTWRAPAPTLAERLVEALRQATDPGLGVDTTTLLAQHERESFDQTFRAALARLPVDAPNLEHVATLMAGAEALVELAERGICVLPPGPDTMPGEQKRLWPAELLVTLALRIDGGAPTGTVAVNLLLSFAYALAARVATLHGDLAAAQILFNRSLSRAPREQPGEVFADWRVPDEPLSRLMLQTILALHPGHIGVVEAIGRINRLDTQLNGPDAIAFEPNLPGDHDLNPPEAGPQDRERLLSLLTSLRLACEPPQAQSELQQHTPEPLDPAPAVSRSSIPDAVVRLGVAARDSWPDGLYRDVGSPVVYAHRLVAPAFAAGLDAETSGWPMTPAYEALRRIATGDGPLSQEHEIRAAERRLLTLDRRLRLSEVLPPNQVSLLTSPDPGDAWLAWALEGLAGREAPPAPERTAAWAHTEWRTRPALTPGARARAIAWARAQLGPLLVGPNPGHQEPDLLWAALILDAVEVQALADQAGDPLGGLGTAAAQIASAVRVAQSQPQAGEGLRLLLRAEALRSLVSSVSHLELFDPDWIGLRAAASIALEEGELLMLRLPRQSHTLFRRAADWYEAAGDIFGSWIAATGLTLLSLNAGIPPRFLNSLVGRAERLYREFLAASGDDLGDDRLPPFAILTRLAAEPQVWLRDGFGPPLLRPWLLRFAACLAARADGDGAPAHAAAFLTWLRAAPTPLLADWQPLIERVEASETPAAPLYDEARPLDRRALRLALTNLFSSDELRLLCADIGVAYDELPGETKGDRVLHLLTRLEQTGRRDKLTARLLRLRPALEQTAPAEQPLPLEQPPSQAQLEAALTEGFNSSELRALAWDLGLDFQALPDQSPRMAAAIVAQADRRDQRADLLRLVLSERPALASSFGSPRQTPTPRSTRALRTLLAERFDTAELAMLADELGLVQPKGDMSRSEQIVALLDQVGRRGRLASLEQLIARHDPEAAAALVAQPAASRDATSTAGELEELVTSLDRRQLAELASDLGIDMEQLPGHTDAQIARELVLFLRRHGRLAELREALAERAPAPAAVWLDDELLLRVQPAERVQATASPLDAQRVRLSLHRQQGAATRVFEYEPTALSAAIDYNQFLAQLPPDLRELIQTVHGQRSDQDQPLAVTIEASPLLHGPPWDALVLSDAPIERLPIVRRTVPGVYGWRPPLSDDEPVQVFIPGEDKLVQTITSPAWRSLAREPQLRQCQVISSSSPELSASDEVFQILHLFGSVLETGRGLRLFVGAERAIAPSSQARAVSAEELVRLHASLSIAILQAPPLRGGRGRIDATRREAVLLRSFAASLHEAGVPVVLVLPALEVQQATAIVAQVARASIGPGAQLVERLRQSRMAVAAPATGQHDSGSFEAVFDFTLFAPT